MHPGNNQAVTFQLKAKNPNGIQRVTLYVYEYELTTDAQGLPAKRGRSNGVWGLEKTWEINSKQAVTLEHQYSKGFKRHSHVEYIFNVEDVHGNIEGKLALFDAGDSPWERDKILLYATTRQPMKERLNVCFFMDTDYRNNWPKFIGDLSGLIYEGYHQNNMIAEDKDMWAFYYTKQIADGKAISSDCFDTSKYPDFVKDTIIEGIDAFGLIHQENYSDGAYMYGNLTYMAYNMFTAEHYNYGTAIHETSHAIFRLNDEYQGCSCFEAGNGSNVFSKLADCQAFNRLNGFPSTDCTELTHGDGSKWYLSEEYALFRTMAECQQFNRDRGYQENSCTEIIELDNKTWFKSTEGACIMHDDGNVNVPDFQRTCVAVISYYYDQLRGTSGPMIAQNSRMDNIFGYEPVVNITQSFQAGRVNTAVQQVRYGVPAKNIVYGRKGSHGAQSRETFRVHAPTNYQIIVHRPNKQDEVLTAKPSKSTVTVPYNASLKRVMVAEKPITVPSTLRTSYQRLIKR